MTSYFRIVDFKACAAFSNDTGIADHLVIAAMLVTLFQRRDLR